MTWETIVTILGLGVLGAALPWAILRRLPDTQQSLLVALAISAVSLTLIGAGTFAWLYAEDLGAETLLSVRALWHFWTLGVRAALIWLPVMLLAGLSLAQGIERRKGERLALRDPD